MGLLIEVISAVRNVRGRWASRRDGAGSGDPCHDAGARSTIETHRDTIINLARLKSLSVSQHRTS